MLMYPVITMDGPAVHAGSRKALLGAAPTAEACALMSVETPGDRRHAADAADPHPGRSDCPGREQHPVLPGADAGQGAGRNVSVRAWRPWHGHARGPGDGVASGRAARKNGCAGGGCWKRRNSRTAGRAEPAHRTSRHQWNTWVNGHSLRPVARLDLHQLRHVIPPACASPDAPAAPCDRSPRAAS